MKSYTYVLCFIITCTLVRQSLAQAHSVYDEQEQFLDPAAYKALLAETAGHFYGIGIELAPKKSSNSLPMITGILPQGPAAKAGLQKGDLIATINGRSTKKLRVEKCIHALRSTIPDSSLSLDILRAEGDREIALHITITRAVIPEENCWSISLESGTILCIIITRFTKQTPVQLEQILKAAARSDKLKGIILDLRDNNGGVLQAAIDCAGFFLPKQSTVVYTKNKDGELLQEFHTLHEPHIKKVPMVILINEDTASSAEILAQSLKIHARQQQGAGRGRRSRTLSPHIFTLGTTSYGKASIQEIRPVGENCAVQLTTAYYYFSDNSTPHRIGITPDFVVPYVKPSGKRGVMDNQVQAACTILKELRSHSTVSDFARLRGLSIGRPSSLAI